MYRRGNSRVADEVVKELNSGCEDTTTCAKSAQGEDSGLGGACL